MAGEIQVNSVTALTESGSNIVLNNVNTATNRTNLGMGSIATQNANAVALTGGSITGTEIDLKSTGTSVYKSDGTTAVISESSGTVTVNNSTLGNSVVFPSGHIIKVNYYTIGSGTLTNNSFPADNTIPQRTEGTEVWSQSITPSASANYLLIQAHVKLNETSSLTNEMALGLFISDSLDALVISQGVNERSSGGGPFNDFPAFINYRMASWGASAKTLSLRSSGAQAYNYFDQYGSYSSGSYYNGTITSSVIIWEIV